MVVLIAILLFVIILILGYVIFMSEFKLIKADKKSVANFKTAMELIGLPVLTFHQGDKKYHFLLDTGSNCSYILKDCGIEFTPTDESTEYMGIGAKQNSCPIGIVKMFHKEKEYCFRALVADISETFAEVKNTCGIQLHGILGTDFMDKYSYVIDFYEQLLYRRK